MVAKNSKPSASSGATEQEPRKVQLWDGSAVKTALDECARDVVLENGYDEDVSVVNTKILLGLAAIGLALYAQFGAGKFPGCWWPVAFCVGGYSLLSLVLNAHAHWVEGDACLICKPRNPADLGLRVCSSMARFDDKYTLTLCNRAPAKSKDYREVTSTDSVAKFFHADGYFSEPAFKAKVEELLGQFESGASKKRS